MPAAVLTPALSSRTSEDQKTMPGAKEVKTVDARLLKKREADRKCQRKIRERAKARVASLEQVVEELKKQDTTGQVEALLKKLTEKNSEIEALNRKVKSIQAVLSDQGTGDSDIAADNVDFDESDSILAAATAGDATHVNSHIPLPGKLETEKWAMNQRSLVDIPITMEQIDTPFDSSNLIETYSPLYDSIQDSTLNTSFGMVVANSDPIIPASPKPCDCSRPSSDIGAPRNVWRFANEVLSSRFTWPDHYNALDDPFADDTPVRAVVEGWDAVERHGPLHPSWQILKKIDQGVFWSCNPRERLAILHVMHMLFDAHSRPEMMSDLPDYYRKRPSEAPVHSYAINFFTWPGMRERFVQQQHRYCTNDFWKILVNEFRVLWPYEFRDCYARNVETGLYSISPSFSDRLRDIKVWTLGPAMFRRFPEFAMDAPVLNSIPPAVPSKFPNSKMLTANTDRRARSAKSRQGSAESNLFASDHATPLTMKLSPLTSKPSDAPWMQSIQPLMWDSDFTGQGGILLESEYLSPQNLDGYSLPYA